MVKPDDVSDVPLAVLIGRDGYERVWRLTSIPPPPDLLIPRQEPLSLVPDYEPSLPRREPRRFRLSPSARAPGLRWWHVYNEGRSRTPEDGFVYLEILAPKGQE